MPFYVASGGRNQATATPGRVRESPGPLTARRAPSNLPLTHGAAIQWKVSDLREVNNTYVNEPLLTLTDDGLFCPAGGFHVDPWNPVARAVITHAHADHAKTGSGTYLATDSCRRLLETRLGPMSLDTLPYGQSLEHGGMRISFHPAGHVLGSAQVRLEHRGQVWVVSGDYKLEPDPTCTPFESVRCHTFITESTFALPIYRWDPPADVFAAINGWWRTNRDAGRASVVYAYALGKAQRLMAGVDASIGPI